MCDIQNCCYLCLNKKENLLQVHQEHLDDSINIRIKYVLPELIHFGPEVPVLICCACLVSLTSFYLFKKKCLENNLQMKNFICRLQDKNNDQILQNKTIPITQSTTERPARDNEPSYNNQQVINSSFEEQAMNVLFKNEIEIADISPSLHSSTDRKFYQEFLNNIKSQNILRADDDKQDNNFNKPQGITSQIKNNKVDQQPVLEALLQTTITTARTTQATNSINCNPRVDNHTQDNISNNSYDNKRRYEASKDKLHTDLNNTINDFISSDFCNYNNVKLAKKQTDVEASNTYKNIVNSSQIKEQSILLISSIEDKGKSLKTQTKDSNIGAVLSTELNDSETRLDKINKNSNDTNIATKEIVLADINTIRNRQNNTQIVIREQRAGEKRSALVFEMQVNCSKSRFISNGDMLNDDINGGVNIKDEFIPFDHYNYNHINNNLNKRQLIELENPKTINNKFYRPVSTELERTETTLKCELNSSKPRLEDTPKEPSYKNSFEDEIIIKKELTEFDCITDNLHQNEESTKKHKDVEDTNIQNNTILTQEHIQPNFVENDLNNKEKPTDLVITSENTEIVHEDGNISKSKSLLRSFLKNGSIEKRDFQNNFNEANIAETILKENIKDDIDIEENLDLISNRTDRIIYRALVDSIDINSQNNIDSNNEPSSEEKKCLESEIIANDCKVDVASCDQQVMKIHEIVETNNSLVCLGSSTEKLLSEDNLQKDDTKCVIDIDENFIHCSSKDRAFYNNVLIKGNCEVLSANTLSSGNESNTRNIDFESNLSNIIINEVLIDLTHFEEYSLSEEELPQNTTSLEENSRRKLYYCDLCFKPLLSENNLKTHKSVVHDIKSYKCTVDNCNENFHCARDLTIHIKKAHGCAYKCSICDKTYLYKKNLLTHEKIHTNACEIHCPVCPKKFAYKNSLSLHMLRHSDTQKNIECRICNRKFALMPHLKFHLIQSHDVKIVKEIKFDCEHCGKNFKRAGNLVQHSKIHTGVKKFECSVCKKKFLLNTHLKQHMEQVHVSEKKYKCSDCNKAFVSERCLKKHLETHKKKFETHKKINKKYKCNICNEVLASNIRLKRHIMTHSDNKKIRKYKCSDCNKTFVKKSLLTYHIDTYHNESDEET